jgi:hypothetical protein
LFYEDYSFHAEIITDIEVSELIRKQEIQAAFPSPLNPKIPMIIKGHAYYKKIDNVPYVELKFDNLSLDAEHYMPAEILVTSVNGQKIKNQRLKKITPYKSGLKTVKTYAKDLVMFPLYRYQYNPTMGKPTRNTFIVLLEPFYAFGGAALYAISPITANFYRRQDSSDIPRGTVIEFEFLNQIPYPTMDDL